MKQFIENPKMRRPAVQALLNLVNSLARDNTVDVMIQKLKPLLPMLQDLAEYPNSQQKDAVKILGKLGNPPDETYEQDMNDSTPKTSYSLALVIIFFAVLAAGSGWLILSRRRQSSNAGV